MAIASRIYKTILTSLAQNSAVRVRNFHVDEDGTITVLFNMKNAHMPSHIVDFNFHNNTMRWGGVIDEIWLNCRLLSKSQDNMYDKLSKELNGRKVSNAR